MNKPQVELKTKQSLSYTFQEDIDNVYKAFFSPRILTTVGLLGSLFDITEIRGAANLDHVNCQYKMTWKTENKFHLDLTTIEKVQDECLISISQRITSMNYKPVTSILIIKYSFYRETCDNSTIVFLETIYEKEDDEFYKEYCKNVDEQKKILFVQQIEKYLKGSNKNKLQIESIVINRPFHQVWQFFSDFYNVATLLFNNKAQVYINNKNKEGNKANKNEEIVVEGNNNDFRIRYSGKKTSFNKEKAILSYEKEIIEIKSNANYCHLISINFYKLCSMSCFLSAETMLDFHVNGKYLSSLSHKKQKILKKVKRILEKMTCYFE